MQKLFIVIMAFLLVSVVVHAESVTCKDEDGSPVGGGTIEDSIEHADTVEYGLTDKTDECVSGRDGYHKDPSSWIREYYCANVSGTIQRTHKDIDCVREGYTRCEGGKCVGKDSTTTTSTSTPAVEQPRCGDEKIQSERGEQCEPPDDICYSNDQIGICTRPNAQGLGGCQCKLYKGGSETTEPVNETPEESPVSTPQPPAEEPATEAPPAENATLPENPPAPEEREPLPAEFEEGDGIGITRAITNSVKRFFHWIGSWFD